METSSEPAVKPSVVVVADDLIWATRLAEAVKRAGARAVTVQAAEKLEPALNASAVGTPVIVDLSGRTYDGLALVAAASAGGHRVLAVGQHEDQQLRRRALDAGAVRVFSYNKLFTDGPDVVASLLEGSL